MSIFVMEEFRFPLHKTMFPRLGFNLLLSNDRNRDIAGDATPNHPQDVDSLQMSQSSASDTPHEKILS